MLKDARNAIFFDTRQERNGGGVFVAAEMTEIEFPCDLGQIRFRWKKPSVSFPLPSLASESRNQEPARLSVE